MDVDDVKSGMAKSSGSSESIEIPEIPASNDMEPNDFVMNETTSLSYENEEKSTNTITKHFDSESNNTNLQNERMLDLNNTNDFTNCDSQFEENTESITKRLETIIDKDSGDESIISKVNEIFNKNDESHKSPENFIKHKRLVIVDSDSESDEMEKLELKDINDEESIFDTNIKTSIQDKRNKRFIDSDDSEDEVNKPHKNNDINVSESNVNVMEKLKGLVDSDSEDDNSIVVENTENQIFDRKISRSFGQEKEEDFESSTKVTNVKEAMEQRKQIQSESQRMLRESRVSLPYHRPKSHTFKEFLTRRTRLSDIVAPSSNIPTALAIKMTPELLKIAKERLEQREKEIEEFYKSESESDNEKQNNEEETDKNKNNEQESTIDTNTENNSEIPVCCENNEDITENNLLIELPLENVIEKPDDITNEIETITENVLQDDNSQSKNISIEQPKEDPVDVEINFVNIESVGIKTPTELIMAKPEKKFKKINPLVSLKSTFQPRLSGGPNEIIVLDDDLTKSKAVNDLMKRFLNHTTARDVKKTEEISILNFDGTALHNETHKINVEDKENLTVTKQTPGAKFKKLREELEKQMTKKKYEQWMIRQKEKENENKENVEANEQKLKGEIEEELLDDDEEEAMTESESSDSEEDETEIPEKPRVKSVFLDEEAEESDDNDADSENSDDEIEEYEFNDDIEITDEQTKKQLKRIIQNFEESDDDSKDNTFMEDILNLKNKNTKDETDSKMSWEEDEDTIPSHQPQNQNEKTPCKLQSQGKQDLPFLTPIMQLSALQGMNSATKLPQDSPKFPLYSLPSEPSPLRTENSVKTKLFDDNSSINEDSTDELEALCSGKFTGLNTQQNVQNNSQKNSLVINFDISQTTSDNFNSRNSAFKNDENELFIENSENMKLVLEYEDSASEIEKKSPEKCNPQNKKIETCTSKVCMKLILSSSEDEDTEGKTKKKKKLKKKAYISDNDSSSNDEENSNLEDEDVTETIKNVDYDSEENEIDLDARVTEEANFKARDFFEAEAELSESEWGSADEDEKDLDQMEIEDGDEEQFNQKKVQRELERIHVRQVLDEDKREVRLLQELLLEDGELHGVGREKKFKWKNSDLNAWNDVPGQNEDDDDLEEIESEVQWRKLRHEREKFLEEQRLKENKNELESIMSNSQLLKMGQAAINKSLSSIHFEKTSVSSTQDIKQSVALLAKRGSFLGRSESMLTRLAEIAKTSNPQVKGPKNSRNFVFTSVVKSVEKEEKTEMVKKRKAIDTLKMSKKFKIIDMSPVAKFKKKS